MNKHICIGRLIKDPELKYTNNNKSICKINIAINNGKDDTTFLQITYFNKIAETISKYCEKGDLIGVEAVIKNNNYIDKEGNKHYDYAFIGQNIEFLSSKSNSTKKEEISENEPKNESHDDTQTYIDFGNEIDEDLGW